MLRSDYGSWLPSVTHEQVLEFYGHYRPGGLFLQAFSDRFGVEPPEEINTAHVLTIVASDMDPATERIITYLATYRVPINVALFGHFVDGDRAYLARTWLLSESVPPDVGSARPKTVREPWNGQDWYVCFGEEAGIRSLDDARRYGFVSAGGSKWFSRSLRSLPVEARIFVYLRQAGYVAVARSSAQQPGTTKRSSWSTTNRG